VSIKKDSERKRRFPPGKGRPVRKGSHGRGPRRIFQGKGPPRRPKKEKRKCSRWRGGKKFTVKSKKKEERPFLSERGRLRITGGERDTFDWAKKGRRREEVKSASSRRPRISFQEEKKTIRKTGKPLIIDKIRDGNIGEREKRHRCHHGVQRNHGGGTVTRSSGVSAARTRWQQGRRLKKKKSGRTGGHREKKKREGTTAGLRLHRLLGAENWPRSPGEVKNAEGGDQEDRPHTL